MPLSKLATSSPTRPRFARRSGARCFTRVAMRARRDEFQAIASSAPTNDYALFCLGRSMQQLGRHREACKPLALACSLAARARADYQAATATVPAAPPGSDASAADALAPIGMRDAMLDAQSFRVGVQTSVAVPRVGARPLFLRTPGSRLSACKTHKEMNTANEQPLTTLQTDIERRLAAERARGRGAARRGARRPLPARLHRPSGRRHARAVRARHRGAQRPARALRARGLLAGQRAPADQARALPPLRRAARACAHGHPPGPHARSVGERRRAASPASCRGDERRRSRSPPTAGLSRSPTRQIRRSHLVEE